MISSYRPGSSPLHRMQAGLKLALFAVLVLGLSLYPHDGWSVGCALAGVCALFLVARFPPQVPAREVWRTRWLLLVLGGALWVFASPLAAWVSTARVAGILLLASLLTLTTRMESLLAVLHRLLNPLRRIGVDADAVAMTVSLALTMIPVVSSFADDIREAQAARGVRLSIAAVVPLLVRTLRHADDVGDALAARGLVRAAGEAEGDDHTEGGDRGGEDTDAGHEQQHDGAATRHDRDGDPAARV